MKQLSTHIHGRASPLHATVEILRQAGHSALRHTQLEGDEVLSLFVAQLSTLRGLLPPMLKPLSTDPAISEADRLSTECNYRVQFEQAAAWSTVPDAVAAHAADWHQANGVLHF